MEMSRGSRLRQLVQSNKDLGAVWLSDKTELEAEVGAEAVHDSPQSRHRSTCSMQCIGLRRRYSGLNRHLSHLRSGCAL